MNSNALNVTAGSLIPGGLIGIRARSASASLVATAYLTVMLLALACAYAGRGLSRVDGTVIISAYLAFVVSLLAVAQRLDRHSRQDSTAARG